MKEYSKLQLKEKYYNSNSRELAKELGMSLPTLMKILKEFGIPAKGKGKGQHKRKSLGNSTKIVNGKLIINSN